MIALAAARLGDPVGHPFDWGAAGAAVGAAIGAGVAQAVATTLAVRGTTALMGLGFAFGGPLGALVAGVVGFGVGCAMIEEAGELGDWLGRKIGAPIGEWLGDVLGLTFDVTTGMILSADYTVYIELKPASRSCVDFACCSQHPTKLAPSGPPESPSMNPPVSGPTITTGSSTVLIGKHPAARVSDLGACTYRILAGARHVYIGGAQEVCECVQLWTRYLDEAEAIIAPHDHDHRARNKVISAAYASLYLGDRRLNWVGLAAYASKQVGCAMDHAQAAMRAGEQMQRLGGGIAAYGTAADLAADYTYEQLGKGNRQLFLDVYPLHRFYQEQGLAKLMECAGSRNPPVPPDAIAGFMALEQGDPAESLRQIAFHEQLNILQDQIYDDYMFRRILIANETRLPMTSPASLNLGVDCSGPRELKFSKSWMSDGKGGIPELYDETERMDWIDDEVAPAYEKIEGTPEHIRDLEEIKRRGEGP